MDPVIQSLPSTTFANRRFTRKQLVDIQTTVNRYSNLSLRELGHTLCEHLNWTTPGGENSIHTCLNALTEMEQSGLFRLPEKMKEKQQPRRQKPIVWSEKTAAEPEISGDLSQFDSITVQMVTEKEEITLWNEYVDRYHYLGYRRPVGTHLRYFIIGEKGGKLQRLGCLLFSFAVPDLACRNQWIGWDKKAEKKRLNRVLNNNRLLLFPWVKIKNLVSKAFSVVTRQIASDWEQRHGFRPLLLETFVDPQKYSGSGYRAANWEHVGRTAGKKGSKRCAAVTQKEVYLYPLEPNFREKLIHGEEKRSRKKINSRATPKSTLKADDPFILLWQNVLHLVFEVAARYDQQWQVRSRLINTMLLILFIFRLVFSKNRQGYGVTSVELWEQCRLMGIPLPQEKPITAAAFSNARKKLNESIFKELNSKIISSYEQRNEQQNEQYRWKGHRLFAVDGSKINLPRQLLNKPYKTPSDNAHYPQGLVSTLYQLQSKIPYDFNLCADNNERTAALNHLNSVSSNDLIIYDRGYFSYAMLYYHLQKNTEAVFRLPESSFNVIKAFFSSTDHDRLVTIEASSNRKARIRAKHPEILFKPLPLRLVKYTHDGTTYVLGTTLLDSDQYSIEALSNLYHARWGVEELYKVSKELMEVDDFHAQSDRGIKQELYAHFVLITINRIFANHTEGLINQVANSHDSDSDSDRVQSPQVRINMKNALVTLARNIEALFLKQSEWITEGINTIVDAMGFCKQKERPGRKYERKSMKPAKKWRPSTPKAEAVCVSS